MQNHNIAPSATAEKTASQQDIGGEFRAGVSNSNYYTGTFHNTGVDVDNPLEPTDRRTGITTLARVEVPEGPNGDPGYLMIGHHNEAGLFVAGPDTDLSQLTKPPDFTSASAPFVLGTGLGTGVTVGRDAFAFTSPGRQAAPAPSGYGANIRNSFGPDASGQHLTVELTTDGHARVTDHSRIGTGIQTRPTRK